MSTDRTERHTPSRVSETLLALGHLCHSLHGGAPSEDPYEGITREDLSKRQLMILDMLSQGLTDDRIAHNLSLSERTVRGEIGTIRDQFCAASRFQLGMRFAGFATEGHSRPPWSCPLQRAHPPILLARSG